MANEILLNHGYTGRDLYFHIREQVGMEIWSTTANDLVTYVDADWANYDLPLTEQGDSGVYVASMLAFSRGRYYVTIYRRMTGSPLITDPIVGSGTIEWGNGMTTFADVESVSGTAISSTAGFFFESFFAGLTNEALSNFFVFWDNGTLVDGWKLSDLVYNSYRGDIVAASGTSITLDAGASSYDDFYNGAFLYIYNGSGTGQVRLITDYVGATQVATIESAFIEPLDTSSDYFIKDRGYSGGNILSSFTAEYGDEMARLDVNVSTRAVAGDAMALTTAERGFTADKILNRHLGGGADGGTRTVKNALRSNRNKVEFDVPGFGQFTVYEEDDTTPAWTGTYTRGENTLGPLVSTDPA